MLTSNVPAVSYPIAGFICTVTQRIGSHIGGWFHSHAMEVDPASLPPIHRATIHNDLAGVMALVEDDSQVVSVADDKGHTALHIACGMSRLDIAAYLLDHGANINQQSTLESSTPLSLACMNEHPSLTQLLLDRGADPTIPGQNNNTPLMVAAVSGKIEVVRCLLGHEAAAATINYERGPWTAVAWAGVFGHYYVVQMLLEAGADPTSGYKDGVHVTTRVGTRRIKYECESIFKVRLHRPLIDLPVI